MNIVKMLAELHAEKQNLDEAISVFERVAAGQGKRRGRPPKWMAEAKSPRPAPAGNNKPKRRSKKSHATR